MTAIESPRSTRLEPLEIAPETFVIHNTWQAPGAPVAVHMNAMLIRGEQPVVVDTGAPAHRSAFLDDLFALVEPEDVRWVFVSHDDSDHYGNLHAVMDACPNATFVGTWFLCERIASERLDIAPTRWRWVGDGETLDVGDRVLAALRPPLYDSPTTRGLFDPTTGVYWAADCYASAVPEATAFADELDPGFWDEGFAMFQAWNSPWVTMLDRTAFAAACRSIEQLGLTAIAGAHSPTIGAASLSRAFELLRGMPSAVVPPQPDQLLLDEIVASLSS